MSENEIKETPDRLAREKMSRRWTMAKRLLNFMYIQVIVIVGMMLYDPKSGIAIAEALAISISICGAGVGAVMGIDSFKKNG